MNISFGPKPLPLETIVPIDKKKGHPVDASFFRNLNECFKMGDVVYLPQSVTYEEAGGALRTVGGKIISEIFHKVDIHKEDYKNILRKEDAILGVILLDSYSKYFEENKKEPEWIKGLPDVCKKFVRRMHMIREYDDPLGIVPEVPFSGIGYIVSEGGITEKTISTFNLQRLSHIAQLAKLTDPAVRDKDSETYIQEFNHRRGIHVWNVRVFMELMTARNNFDTQATNTAVVAALTHDMYTPAGGDSVKRADPARFDEDERYSEILQNPEYVKFLQDNKINPQFLVDTVQGKTYLSVFLDMADKISYLGLDAEAYIRRYGELGPKNYPSNEVSQILEKNPEICNLWDSVTLVSDKVVIKDPKRLANFLKLRALMFRDLYGHPGARFMEGLVGNVIMPYLIKKKSVDPERLFKSVDIHIDGMVASIVDERYALSEARVEVFSSAEEAEKAKEGLKEDGVKVYFLENLTHQTSTGAKFFVPSKDGKEPVPFAEAFPDETKELEDIMKPKYPFRLYYLPKDFPASKELIEAIESAN